MKKEEKKPKRSDNIIPDYGHLFDNEKTSKNKKGKAKILTKILKINRWHVVSSTLVYILQALPVWVTPILTAYIINLVTQTLASGGQITSEIWRTIIICSIILAVVIVSNVPTTMWRYRIVSKMNRRASAGIKSAVVRKLQYLSITYHKDMQSGKIQSKFLKDTESIDALLSNVMHHFVPCIINVIIAIAISVYNNGLVALFFLVVIPINVILPKMFRNKIKNTNRAYRLKIEELGAKMNTMLEMMPVTKSHGLENTEIVQFDKTIRELSGSGIKLDKTVSHFGSWVFVVNAILSSTCVVFCSILALNGIIGVGDIVLYQSMFSQISGSVSAIVGLIPAIATGVEALNSVSEIMNATDVETSIGKKKTYSIKGDVKFDNVCYRYPASEQDVVHNFSLDIKQGECIAVVGSSGSGKSTLMNLIIGFMMPNSGKILIDGQPITELNLSQYRQHISVVPQNSILFMGSIKDNITYGKQKYTQKDLDKVIEMANLQEFLDELPDGINTEVGEHGGKLSGGQRQRITIARALIRDPSILILDEATSALDNISEFHVQKAIASSIKGRTTFIVAHRLSTIRDADRIVVMEQGEMVECGTYEELMEKKGKFYKLKELNEINLKKAEEGLQ